MFKLCIYNIIQKEKSFPILICLILYIPYFLEATITTFKLCISFSFLLCNFQCNPPNSFLNFFVAISYRVSPQIFKLIIIVANKENVLILNLEYINVDVRKQKAIILSSCSIQNRWLLMNQDFTTITERLFSLFILKLT